MKYTHHKIEYEIDDEWLDEAGVRDLKPNRDCYRAKTVQPQTEVFEVLIDSVEPLTERSRLRGFFCDDKETGDSAKKRVIRILRWFREDQEIEPVKVVKSKNPDYEYKLLEGCHRFHCANAMGFKSVPATLGFDINDPFA